MTITTDFMIITQKLTKKQFFYLYISTIYILYRKLDNPIETYLARRFEVQISCQNRNPALLQIYFDIRMKSMLLFHGQPNRVNQPRRLSVGCIRLCTPGMGVNLSACACSHADRWGESPLYVNPVNI